MALVGKVHSNLVALDAAYEQYDGRLYARWRTEVARVRNTRGMIRVCLYLLGSACGMAIVALINIRMVFAIPGFANVLLFIIGLKPSPAPLRLKALMADTELEESFPVAVTLCYKGRTYGSSLGMVAFTSGWMIFEGERFSCAIRSGDAMQTISDGRKASLKFADDRTMEVSFFDRWERKGGVPNVAKGIGAARTWRKLKQPRGDSVYPPRRLERASRRRPAHTVVGAALVVAGTACGIATPFGGASAAMLAFWAALLVVGGVVAVRLREGDEDAWRELQPDA